jgi:hypothetical protein
VGVTRLLWGADITLDTALAKLRYLETLLGPQDIAAVRYRNAQSVFPRGTFA